MNDQETVVLRTFAQEIDAEMARGHLAAQGITATILRNDLRGLTPLRNKVYGFRLVVLRADQQEAEETLKAMGV